jgi:hypothetical protein
MQSAKRAARPGSRQALPEALCGTFHAYRRLRRDTRCWGERRSANRASWALQEPQANGGDGSIGIEELRKPPVAATVPPLSAEDQVGGVTGRPPLPARAPHRCAPKCSTCRHHAGACIDEYAIPSLYAAAARLQRARSAAGRQRHVTSQVLARRARRPPAAPCPTLGVALRRGARAGVCHHRPRGRGQPAARAGGLPAAARRAPPLPGGRRALRAAGVH